MEKRNFSFPIPPRIIQLLIGHAESPTPTILHPYDIEMGRGEKSISFSIFLAQAVQAAAAYFYPMANMKCQSFGCKNRRRGKTSRRVENMMLASKLRICSLDTIVNTVFVHLKLFNNTVFFFLFMFCIMLIK